MSGPEERTVPVPGGSMRVWEKGEGEPLAVLSGLYGYACWNAFLESLSQRRRVIVPSLPGLPGGADFRALDDLTDWIAATLDLADAAGIAGVDWVGLGPGGLLAAEVAALSGATVGRLTLVAPFGLFEVSEPVTDFWALRKSEVGRTFSADPERFVTEVIDCPEDFDAVEWEVQTSRSLESAARLLWPMGDRGLAKRLHRIRCETLLVWGSDDAIVPASYAKRFAEGIAGPTTIHSIDGAGHRVDLDASEELADAIEEFLS